jgi:hypothetical protein
LQNGNPSRFILSEAVPAIVENEPHVIRAAVDGDIVTCTWDDEPPLSATDTQYGAAGDIVVGTLRGRAAFDYVVVYALGD